MPRPGQQKKAKKGTGFLDDCVNYEWFDGRSIYELSGPGPVGGNGGNPLSNEDREEKELEKRGQQNAPGSDQNGSVPQISDEHNISEEDIEKVDIDNLINNDENRGGSLQVNPQPAGPNGFVPQQTKRSKWSKASQAATASCSITGSALNSVVNMGTLCIPAIVTHAVQKSVQNKIKKPIRNEIQKTDQNKIQKDDQKEVAVQEKRTHRSIPGRWDETFDPKKSKGKDILEDFRRIPTVWSYITAGKAVDEEGRDIPPKVTAYFDQPKTGSSKTMNGEEMGHTMLGIEYTRPSKITGKKERYNIRYGFYPAGGMSASAGAAMMLKGALLPGQLCNDVGHKYDISKTYAATRHGIEKIAKASERYTDKGGYGYYTRNCATFVRDMFREGGIPDNTINTIFTSEMIRFTSKENAEFVVVNLLNGVLDAHQQRNMARLTKKDDLTYQGWGNKRVTKKDFQRYLDTRNTSGFGAEGLSPAFAGENARRMRDNAQLRSLKYAPASMKNDPKDTADKVEGLDLVPLRLGITEGGIELQNKIIAIMPPAQLEAAGEEFHDWVAKLNQCGNAVRDLAQKEAEGKKRLRKDWGEEELNLYDTVSPQDLKKCYAEISEQMAQVSRNYQTVLGADSRVNKEVMNLLSTMQIALEMLNRVYAYTDKSSDLRELGRLREQMGSDAYVIKLGDIEVTMTPSHYESYLQIYKKPEKALKAYKKYCELDEQKNSRKLSKKEQAELSTLERNEQLAKEFDQSHRDMLNKEDYTQGDIDYAFILRGQERYGETKAGGEMYAENRTAAMTYIALFFDSVFKGILEAAQNDNRLGDSGPTNENKAIAIMWLNRYLTEKAKNSRVILMILRGIMRATKNPDAEKLAFSFHHFLQNAYLKRALPKTTKIGGKAYLLSTMLAGGLYDNIKDNNAMSFTKMINNRIAFVLSESEKINMAKAKDKKVLRNLVTR